MISLHDLRVKVLGKACFELLGEPRATPVVPDASLQPEISDFDAYVEYYRIPLLINLIVFWWHQHLTSPVVLGASVLQITAVAVAMMYWVPKYGLKW